MNNFLVYLKKFDKFLESFYTFGAPATTILVCLCYLIFFHIPQRKVKISGKIAFVLEFSQLIFKFFAGFVYFCERTLNFRPLAKSEITFRAPKIGPRNYFLDQLKRKSRINSCQNYFEFCFKECLSHFTS